MLKIGSIVLGFFGGLWLFNHATPVEEILLIVVGVMIYRWNENRPVKALEQVK